MRLLLLSADLRTPSRDGHPPAESLSLSHAVSVVLSRIFEARQQASGYALPQGRGDLAAGFEETGVER